MRVERFLEQAARQRLYRASPPATMALIAAAEKQLSTVFSDSYKTLLLRVGSIHWFGHAVFGVTGDPEDDTTLRTEAERSLIADLFEEHERPIPAHGNIIGEIYGGGFCVLHSVQSLRSGHVSAHAPDDRFAEVHYWPSIESYFEYLITGARNWLEL